MSHQLTFADSEFSTKRRQTRKEIFLSRMEQILPWQNMTAVIEPFYPKAGNGRRPYPLETMLRIHCMQHWYNLSDGAMEDALYEIASMRLFARLSLDSALPDRTTIMNFRHLLEQHQLARQLFKTINRWLAEAGVMMTQGTVVVKFFWTRRSDGRVMHRRATGRQGWPAFRTVRVIGSQVLNAIGYCYKS